MIRARGRRHRGQAARLDARRANA